MKRALKWIKRIVLGTLAIVIVAVITVLIILHTDWGRDKARRIALDQLQKFFPGGIHVEKIQGSVLGDIELVGVTINGFDKKQMVHIAKARTNLAIGALFTKTIKLEYIEVDGLEVTDPSNPVKLEETKEPFTWTVELPDIRVRNARVAITGEQPTTLENVSIDARLSVADVLSAGAKITGRWKEKAMPLTVETSALVGENVVVPKLVVTLADSRVEVTDVLVDLDRPIAKISIHATPEVVRTFAGFEMPAPADVTLDIDAFGLESRIDLEATMGGTSLGGRLYGDLAKRRVRGMLAANNANIGGFVPRITGSGSGVVTLVADQPAGTAHVLAIVEGQLLDLPAGHAMLDLEASETKGGRAILLAGGAGDLRTFGIGTLTRDQRKFDVKDAHIVSTVRDASKVTNGKVPFRGPIAVAGSAKGSIAPKLHINLAGSVVGQNLMSSDPKMSGLAIGKITGTATGSVTELGTFTSLDAIATNVSRGGAPIGSYFKISAHNRADGKIAADLEAHPAALPAVAKIDATVDLGSETSPIVIELGDHSVTSQRVTWEGSGGTITLGEKEVVVKDIASTSGKASLAIGATVNKVSGALDLDLVAKDVPASMIDPAYMGTVSATVDVTKRGILWDGTVKAKIDGVALGKEVPAIEGTVDVTIKKSRITADISANTFQIGGVRLVIDVDGPRDITDALAWRRLERTSIRAAMLAITRLDLGALRAPGGAAMVKTGGIVDGELVLTGTDTSGTFAIKAVQTPAGVIEGDIQFAPIGNDVGASSTLRLAGFGEAHIAAQIVVPAHPFEPAEWRRLGRGVVRVMTASVEDVVIEPQKLAKLGIEMPYSAKVGATVQLSAGTGEARATFDVKGLQGGKLVKPVDVTVEAGIDPKETRAAVTVSTGNRTLTQITGKLPAFGFDRWLAAAGDVKTAQLEGRLDIPDVDIVELLAMFNRTDILTGKLNGAILVGGTPAAPTADASIVISNVNVRPRLAGRKLPALTELKLTGKWDGSVADVVIAGREDDGATLSITAHVPSERIATSTAKIDIRNWDIAPVAVFLPGPLVAATGKVGAKITMAALAPNQIRGTLSLAKGRMPIHPKVGTLRDTNLAIKLNDQGLFYTLTAKIGAGSVKLKGTAPPDLTKVTLDGTVDKYSPIGTVQPVITATLAGTIFREENDVHADVNITKANVTLDMEKGVDLLDDSMPEDLYIGRTTPPPKKPKEARLPRKPWIIVDANLATTPLFVKHELFEVRARANAKRGIRLSIGRTFDMDGSIEIERGNVDVIGRHYRVDPSDKAVVFDGTLGPTGAPDPKLAIRLTHEFPELTLTAHIAGRASKRELRMSGTPEVYSQDELLAFFAGAEPSGDTSTATRDAAQNLAAAVVSAKLGRQAKKVLPFKIDVINCDAGSATSSSACKLGKWLTDNWFLEVKQHIEPKPDESPQEILLRYYFRRNWVIEGGGFTERFGGDILWRKPF